MKPPIPGLIHVTGEPDAGKTIFSLSTGAIPEETAFFDDDLKTQALQDSLKRQGHPMTYFNLARSLQRIKPDKFYTAVTDHIKALENNRYEVLVFDNFTRMEDAIRAYSLQHITEISELTPGQVKGMSQLTWPYTFVYYTQVLDLMLSKAPLIIIATHIREKYVGSHGIGLMEPRGQRPLTEKSNLRLWLRHNSASPAPIGLVLKRIVEMRVTDTGMKPVNVLPRKITPCTWDRIIEYMAEPIGDRPPRPDETPNEFELSILDGTLTADMRDALKLALLSAEGEDNGLLGGTVEPSVGLTAEAQELIAAGKVTNRSASEIKADLSAAGYDVPLIKIIKALKNE